MRTELYIQIDPLSEVALYEQIAEQLKHLILTGTLAEHTPLPSVRGLAQMLGISVITTRRAYTELEAQGYVLTLDFPGSPKVKKRPDNAGDMGSIPGLGGSHMLWSN